MEIVALTIYSSRTTGPWVLNRRSKSSSYSLWECDFNWLSIQFHHRLLRFRAQIFTNFVE